MSAIKSLKSSFDDLSPHVKIILPYILWVIEYYSQEPTWVWSPFLDRFFPHKKGQLFWMDKDYLLIVPIDDELLSFYNLNTSNGRSKYYNHSAHAFRFLKKQSIVKCWYSSKKSYLIHVNWKKVHKLKQLLDIIEKPEDLGDNYMNKKGEFYYDGKMLKINPKTQAYKYINYLQKKGSASLFKIYNKIPSNSDDEASFAKHVRKNTKTTLCPAIMSSEEFEEIFIVENSSHKIIKCVKE